MKVGFVGTGAITSAIVTGLSSGFAGQQTILLSPRNSAISADLALRFPDVSVASSNQHVLDGSEVVVLAVRPQDARNVISELRFRPDQHVISLIATFSVAKLAALVFPATKITRAVPLPAVADRTGATAVYPPDALAAELFNKLGVAIEVEGEDEFDALSTATATLASYFRFADSVTSWLTRHGVPERKARDYIGSIFLGLARTAANAPAQSFESLARDHTTLGGINEQVLAHLVATGAFERISEGLDAVYHRIQSAR